MRHLPTAPCSTCLVPLILLRMLWRSPLAPAYRERLAERFGFIPPDAAAWGAAGDLGARGVGGRDPGRGAR